MRNHDPSLCPDATGTDRTDLVADDALRAWARRLSASPEQIRSAIRSPADRSAGSLARARNDDNSQPLTVTLGNG